MKKFRIFMLGMCSVLLLCAFSFKSKVTTIYLIGDSTVADYSLEENYQTKKFPQVGWGQVLQPFFQKDSLKLVKNILGGVKEVKIDDRAKGAEVRELFFRKGAGLRFTSHYKKEIWL